MVTGALQQHCAALATSLDSEVWVLSTGRGFYTARSLEGSFEENEALFPKRGRTGTEPGGGEWGRARSGKLTHLDDSLTI